MWFHIQKRREKHKDREEVEVSFVSVLLKTSLRSISKSRLLSGCSLGEAVRAHLIFYMCSHFPFLLCIPALQPILRDGDSLSSKEPIKFHITLADTRWHWLALQTCRTVQTEMTKGIERAPLRFHSLFEFDEKSTWIALTLLRPREERLPGAPSPGRAHSSQSNLASQWLTLLGGLPKSIQNTMSMCIWVFFKREDPGLSSNSPKDPWSKKG